MFCGNATFAQDGYWIASGGGSWANGGNWDTANGIAGGADNTAYFGFAREATVSSYASFSLDAPQTIGNLFFTTQNGPGSWTFSCGTGGSLTLENSFGPPRITITSPSLQVVLNADVAGDAGVEKAGPGTLILSGANTYSGQTVVAGGQLNIAGSIGAGVTVSGGTLGGTGVIGGPVVVGSGGMLSLGNPSGSLTINNSLVLLPGSTTVVALNPAVPSQAAVQGLSGVTLGGTLILSNIGSVSLGQAFSLFGSVPASGNFNSILPPPGPWLRWLFNPATGALSVVSSASQPAFAAFHMNGGQLVLQMTSGPPGSPCYVIATSDLGLPKPSWGRIGTNVFDMSGCFTSTNSAAGAGQVFVSAYIIPAP